MFLADSVVPTSIVVSSVFLACEELVRVEQLSISPSANLIYKPRKEKLMRRLDSRVNFRLVPGYTYFPRLLLRQRKTRKCVMLCVYFEKQPLWTFVKDLLSIAAC